MVLTHAVRVNPLKDDALTVDTVHVGMAIKYWTPGDGNSVRRAVIASAPYVNEHSDLVIDLRYPNRTESTELTSRVGLSSDREGAWTVIAIEDDEY